MNLKQLRYFAAVADLGSISLAAASVRIAQSAISSQIARLEAELGIQLFVRHGRGVTLTAPGRVLLDHARRINDAIFLAKRDVQAAGAIPGDMAIGIPVSMSPALTLPLMRAIETTFPGAQVHIFEGLTGDLRAWLRSGKVETAILYGDDDADGLELVPLADDELVLFGAMSKPDQMVRGHVDFEVLSTLPIFTTDEDHPVRPLLERTARSFGKSLKFAGRINSVQQLKNLAILGQGYTVLPMVAAALEVRSAPELVQCIEPTIRMRSFVASRPGRNRLLSIILSVTADLINSGAWPGSTMAS